MSGPVGPGGPPPLELSPSRQADVGGTPVRRALPQRHRRTVGAWCFADHLGPIAADAAGVDRAGGIGPHPHIGLHTVTWLLAGELVHRDSLGSEQTIRPGQLNLMTAGAGVSHAEEPTGRHPDGFHGIQLWVAQPDSTRHGAAAFEHHADLPRFGLEGGVATVLVGEMGRTRSPARCDTAMVGADLDLTGGRVTVPLDPGFEHALVVLEGGVLVEGATVVPGSLAYLGPGAAELVLTATGPARLLLLGGAPFESPVAMWWNFVGRTRDELVEAAVDWNDGAPRFGETGSSLERIPAPRPWWEASARS